MLVGQQLGPFVIERELGAGAMGAVYRGKYTKTGQVVAIKVMAPGLGSSALARFEREANILKQMHHPNIVRLFGVGKSHGTAYYAMEYVQGESLDRVMARRGRMSWEEVVDLGTQLCAALQHAHEQGIVHRDLKPSNLMILSDGTLKLTDFGIAKDLDVTALTGANSTIGTAAYMSPEQCRGDPHINFKSDLYSLGVVFYELITGKKPFHAETAMDMFLQHANGTFERPSRVVLDLPVWMDNLICQLLEKNPEHRPRDAAMVSQTLATIQEKVEALQSAGVDAVRGTGETRKNATEADREAARSLMGKKSKKKKKQATKRWQTAVQAAGLGLLLLMVVGGIVFALRPPSPEKLHGQAERLIKAAETDSENAEKRDRAREKLERAREGPIRDYLGRFGKQEGTLTSQVRLWANAYDAAYYEELIHKHIRHKQKKSLMAPEAQTESQKLAFKAAELEYDGDRSEAEKLWKEVLEREGQTGLGYVAWRHLAAFGSIDEQQKRLEAVHREIRTTGKEAPLGEYDQQALLAWRQQRLGDLFGARQRCERLREASTGKDSDDRFWQVYAAVRNNRLEEERFWQLYAAVTSKHLKDLLEKKPELKETKVRKELILGQVQEAQKKVVVASVSLLDLRVLGLDVIALYADDDQMAEVVSQARALVVAVNRQLGK